MADIQNATQNNTLYDENGNVVGITLNATTGLYELNMVAPQSDAWLDMIEGNTRDIHHYQDQGEAFYITYQVTLATKDTEYDVILLTNPSGSGKDFEIQNVDTSVVSMASGNFAKLRMYSNPTITANGTAMTQYNAKVGDANTSGINAFSLPTIAARGGLMSYQSSQLLQPFRIEHWLGTGIEPNNSMLFTMETTANGSILSITIKYVSYTEV